MGLRPKHYGGHCRSTQSDVRILKNSTESALTSDPRTLTLSCIHKGQFTILTKPISLQTCTSLKCVRKLEHPEKTPAGQGENVQTAPVLRMEAGFWRCKAAWWHKGRTQIPGSILPSTPSTLHTASGKQPTRAISALVNPPLSL